MLTKAPIFSDHMVVQRRADIPVWGTADPGAKVTVSLHEAAVCAIAGDDGRWEALLPPQYTAEACDLTITDGADTLVCHDVVFGEVWFAGGQSNMELQLQNGNDGAGEIARSAGSNVRFYNVPKCPKVDDELTRRQAESCWQVCGPDTSATISAVAYFFARQIARSQGVPVGVIDCYWGGTSVSCWMSRAQLQRTVAGQAYIDRYARLVGDKTEAEYDVQVAAYTARCEAWGQKQAAVRRENPDATWQDINAACGDYPWPPPVGVTSPYRPAGLYESMVSRVIPYTVRGFIYYQGEEDSGRFAVYHEMMTLLIDQWRRDWRNDRLPFLFVQLPMYMSQAEYDAHADNKCWPMMRDVQLRVCRTVANTGLTVLTDCGELDNIHPTDKQTVGYRLSLQARKKVYGEDVTADAPIMDRVTLKDGKAEVTFRHTGGGLIVKGGKLLGFEAAGVDGVFHDADAVTDMEKVIVTCEAAGEIRYVRYAWTNYGPANLYGASMLPAAQFRTDDFPVISWCTD